MPGDDDVALPNFIQTMTGLASQGPTVSMISTGYQLIDGAGRILDSSRGVKPFGGQAEALAHLLTGATYALPASGVRIKTVDWGAIPASRTGFDWGTWFQAWLVGEAAIDPTPTLQYRIHPGQEQHDYGTASSRLDATRTLLSVVTSTSFKERASSWSTRERTLFIDYVLSGSGPLHGDARYGAIVQLVLADVMKSIGEGHQATQLFAQASAHAGVVPTVGALTRQ